MLTQEPAGGYHPIRGYHPLPRTPCRTVCPDAPCVLCACCGRSCCCCRCCRCCRAAGCQCLVCRRCLAGGQRAQAGVAGCRADCWPAVHAHNHTRMQWAHEPTQLQPNVLCVCIAQHTHAVSHQVLHWYVRGPALKHVQPCMCCLHACGRCKSRKQGVFLRPSTP